MDKWKYFLSDKSFKNKINTLQTILGIAVIGYGFLCLFSMVDFSFLKGEVVAYGMSCEVKPLFGICPGKTLFASNPRHYKPNVNRQEVLSWVDGFSPDRLTDCAVVDRGNWTCNYNDKSAKFGFQNGEYFEFSAFDNPVDTTYYVSRRVWVNQTCNDSIYDILLCLPLFRLLIGR